MFCAAALVAADRQVSITIDDLPRGGDRGPTDLASIRAMTEHLLRPFREQKIPVIGFVNEGRGGLATQDLRQILDLWLDAGADLGNHSYSHFNLNDTPLEEYTADILKGESVLRAALAQRGRKIEFYRHPFLHTGPTPAVKRGLEQFLERHGYRVAPVTIDTDDYLFAAQYTSPGYKDRVRREYIPYMESVVAFFERRSVEVLGREIPQILLIHASQMNADMMPDLIAMFRRRGYTFVSLDQALRDPAYRLPDQFISEKGISWIHRWGQTKGIPIQYEPDPPKWVEEGWRNAAQDPYRVAPGNYHFVFENEWARATRVTFSPHDRLPVHEHPPTPTTSMCMSPTAAPSASATLPGTLWRGSTSCASRCWRGASASPTARPRPTRWNTLAALLANMRASNCGRSPSTGLCATSDCRQQSRSISRSPHETCVSRTARSALFT